jgi:hypothetical protein
MFGPSVLRETSAFLLTARVPVPTMTSADFSVLPTRGYEDLPW